MLTTKCIQEIKAVPINEVVGEYVDIKKKGANYSGCCPFHNEDTPSFSVSPSKEIYKCFGCGRAGDSIQFVRELKGLTFEEACKEIAAIGNINLEYEQVEYSEKQKAAISAAQLQEEVLNFIIPIYREKLLQLDPHHPVREWLTERQLTDDDIHALNIGFAGTDWREVTSTLINKGWYEPAKALGIIKTARDGESLYDGYRSRIIFPIADKNGRYIGLGGRYLKVVETDSEGIPKWINPADCELYNKSTVLYGLHSAAQAIRDAKCAYVVEGYMDVVSPHRNDLKNVVAPCGTSFTAQQMKLLKKYTDTIIWMGDNDKAGEDAFIRALPEMLSHEFEVLKVKYDGKDPDEFFRAGGNIDDCPKEDGVIYRCRMLWEEAAEDLRRRADAKRYILELIAGVTDPFVRESYLTAVCSLFKWKAADVKKQFGEIFKRVAGVDSAAGDPEDVDAILKPSWVTDEQWKSFEENGFLSVNRVVDGKPMVGYYAFTSSGKTQLTNFLVKPLFHVYRGENSSYLLSIYNGRRTAVLDVQAKLIRTPDQFETVTVNEGNFMIYGQTLQWKRIASELIEQSPRCTEINIMGWQKDGFFAWVDYVYIPGTGLKPLDRWGIVEYGGENYLVPQSSEAYAQVRRTEEDPYANSRFLTYKKSKVSFEQWAAKMNRVYGNFQGVVAIAFVVLTVYRDVVFAVDNNCPLLYFFGEPSSGKSKLAESITAFFYHNRSAFNVNSGTDFAFFKYMEMHRNCPAHMNEVEIETLKQEWFQSFKGAFDGEGRERGKGGSKNKIETQKILSTLILTGQKLITADDNSLVTRSIIEGFSKPVLTEDDRKEYIELKEWEADGLSSLLVDLLNHRAHFVAHYKDSINSLLGEWRREKKGATQLNQRILTNYAHLATCYGMMSQFVDMPVDRDSFTAFCYEKAVHWSNFIKQSDTLSEFWKTLAFLIDTRQVVEGWDYIIKDELEVYVRKYDGHGSQEEKRTFEQPVKVLYLRLSNVHKLFMKEHKQVTGKEAMSEENLKHYFSSRSYYIGPVKSRTFKRYSVVTEEVSRPGNHLTAAYKEVVTNRKPESLKSSCFAFRLDEIGLDIERDDHSMTGPPEDEKPPQNAQEAVAETDGFQPIKTENGEFPF